MIISSTVVTPPGADLHCARCPSASPAGHRAQCVPAVHGLPTETLYPKPPFLHYEPSYLPVGKDVAGGVVDGDGVIRPAIAMETAVTPQGGAGDGLWLEPVSAGGGSGGRRAA
jgi:hypothetical protein